MQAAQNQYIIRNSQRMNLLPASRAPEPTFTHNPNPVSILSSSSMQSISFPALASQSHDSKPLAPKLSIMCVLPVIAT
jgi:hypothetical protein